jgi:hypothetical protein
MAVESTSRTPAQLLAAFGIFLVVFSTVALSGPGRIDIVDGQARFEVAKSIALFGDAVVRNRELWFSVFPGRDGQLYSYYRLPHSLIGALAVAGSDLTGPDHDARRHFFFVLTSAAAAAALAVCYFLWFAERLPRRSAVMWALGGIFCTPSWYYGTSTFDDIFAALAVTGAIVYSVRARTSSGRFSAMVAGLWFGLAFNVKEPLGAFALAGLAAIDNPLDPPRRRLRRAAALVTGLAIGVAAYVAFDLYKFPPGTKAQHAELLAKYFPPFPGNPLWGVAVLTLSPTAGMFWYCPSVVLSIAGLRRWLKTDHRMGTAIAVSCLIFFAFIASISFAKGDPAWGPRYLTPLFAVLWLFAPVGAARFGRIQTGALLLLAVTVQMLALSVDPERLYVDRRLPPTYGAVFPGLNFDIRNAHLVQRPREIYEIWQARSDQGLNFSPFNVPTSAPAVISWTTLGHESVLQYKVLNAFRPWWSSYRYIPSSERGVSILPTVTVLAGALLAGWVLLAVGVRRGAPI